MGFLICYWLLFGQEAELQRVLLWSGLVISVIGGHTWLPFLKPFLFPGDCKQMFALVATFQAVTTQDFSILCNSGIYLGPFLKASCILQPSRCSPAFPECQNISLLRASCLAFLPFYRGRTEFKHEVTQQMRSLSLCIPGYGATWTHIQLYEIPSVETLTMSDISFPPTAPDDGLVTMETPQPPSFTLRYRLWLLSCQWWQTSHAEMFKKMTQDVWGYWSRKTEETCMPGFLRMRHYLTDTCSTHPSSFQEKNLSWLNANSGRAMNIQQPPKRKEGSTMKFQAEY